MKKIVLITTILLLILIFSWSVAKAVGPGDSIEKPTLNSTKYSVGTGESFTLSFQTTSEIPGQTYYSLCPTDASGLSCFNISTLCPADGSQCKKQVITDKYSYSILPVSSFAKEVFYYMVKATVDGKDSVYSKPVKIEYNPTSKITLKSSDNYPVSSNKYSLSWSCNNCEVQAYVLYKSKNSSFSGAEEKELYCYDWAGDPINCSSFTDRNYEMSTYYYKIKAYDFDGNTAESNTMALTMRQPWFDDPKAQEIFAGNTFNIAWLYLARAVSNVEIYELCSSQTMGMCATENCEFNGACQKTEINANTTSFQDKPLKEKPIFSENKNYYYSLRVFYNDKEYSVWSKEKKVTVKPLRPQLEADKKSVNSGETYLLKWPDVNKAEYYYICVSNSPGGACELDSFSARRNSFSTTQDGKRTYQPPAQKPFLTKDYYQRVQARGANPWEEISPWSNEVTVKVVAAEPGLTPAHPLYNLTEIMKRVRFFFIFNPEKKAEQAMSYAQEKLAETQVMVRQNNTKAINQAVGGYAKYLDLAIDKIGKIKNETKKSDLLVKVSQDIYEQQFGLNQLLEQTAAEGKESVTKALDANKETLEKSLKIVPEKEKQIQEELDKIKEKFEPPLQEELFKSEELKPLTPLETSESSEIDKKAGEEIHLTPGVPEEVTEPEPEPEESFGPVCGNSVCESSENCSSCWGDCPCQSGQTCFNGTCQEVSCATNADCNDNNFCTIDSCQNPGTSQASCSYSSIVTCISNDNCCPAACSSTNDNDCQVLCGNGACETGENQTNCCSDCGCATNYLCQNNQCVLRPYCGDGFCGSGESYSNCPQDCPHCGDGVCQAGLGETWQNCSDCPIPPQCSDGLDNDGDYHIDYPEDLGCDSASDNDETDEIACYADVDCEDEDPCTIIYCENPGTVQAYCFNYATIAFCNNNDGCCPGACTFMNDNDCLP